MPIVIVPIALLVILAIVFIVIGISAPDPADALQSRLAEYGMREQPVSLEEIELSLPFSQRVIAPVVRGLAQRIARMTPQQTLETTRHKLELAGNPNNWSAADFLAIRVGAAILLGLLALAVAIFTKRTLILRMGSPLAGAAVGYFFPVQYLNQLIGARKDSITKSLPDALDLLTICVEAGLGFDAAMSKIVEKWTNELSMEFGRVLQEIRLGKLRREALRDMAERTDVPDLTSFVAAIIQADQLGVSIAKVLRIQSDQMRVKRRQRAEEKAHQAPIKMIFPMVFLTFPSIYIVLLGPSALILKDVFF
jgi:tight adherence protein C